ncbi:MAG: C39 family peptidase [Anaerolineaceae bacterium]
MARDNPQDHPSQPVKKNLWKQPRTYLMLLLVMILISVGLYQIPSIHERAYFHLATFRSKIYYFFKPPASTTFEPLAQNTTDPLAIASLTSMAPTATTTATLEPTDPFTPAPITTSTPTAVPTPLPVQVMLGKIILEPQAFNNCGPATLSMALNYWGWEGKQHNVQAVIKPRLEDLAVTPAELKSFVKSETEFSALIRYGGDLDLLRKFVAAGFPVLIERGYFVPSDGWMGHFGVINGYDDAAQTVHIPDSFSGVIDLSYADLEMYWAQFFNTYLIIYPPEKEQQVLALLGDQADETYNLAYTLELETERIDTLSGREQFLAQYNQGTLLLMQKNYPAAAEAYDKAFELYKHLYEEERPWRLLWYEPGPYEAYYYTGRYQDVVNLADKTLNETPSKGLPETYLWRGRANLKLENQQTAIYDFKRALQWHPNWQPALDELSNLGVEP